MKRIIIFIGVVIFTTAFTTIQKQKKMITEDRKAIESLLATYKKALNTSDAKLAQQLYTTNGIFMPSEAPSALGHDQILASYQYIFSQIELNVEFFVDEIEIEQNIAFATTASKGTTLIKALNKTVPEANRELFVFQKVDNKWHIARYMFNKSESQK